MCPAEDAMANSGAAAQPVVLVVEDEVILRLVLAGSLRERGFNVIEAGHGGEAQTLILAGVRPDIIISDITMPGMNGVEFAQWVALNGVDAPIVLTSGRPDSLALAQETCPNVRAFLPKPIDEDALIARLRAVLSEVG
jgi:CheY-like chemotaxis protein